MQYCFFTLYCLSHVFCKINTLFNKLLIFIRIQHTNLCIQIFFVILARLCCLWLTHQPHYYLCDSSDKNSTAKKKDTHISFLFCTSKNINIQSILEWMLYKWDIQKKRKQNKYLKQNVYIQCGLKKMGAIYIRQIFWLLNITL